MTYYFLLGEYCRFKVVNRNFSGFPTCTYSLSSFSSSSSSSSSMLHTPCSILLSFYYSLCLICLHHEPWTIQGTNQPHWTLKFQEDSLSALLTTNPINLLLSPHIILITYRVEFGVCCVVCSPTSHMHLMYNVHFLLFSKLREWSTEWMYRCTEYGICGHMEWMIFIKPWVKF